MTGFGPIEPLLKDPTINDILINTHKQCFVERFGKLYETTVHFKDEAHLLRIINQNRGRDWPPCRRILADGRRALARRLARQHRDTADRRGWTAGLDPQVLRQAVLDGSPA